MARHSCGDPLIDGRRDPPQTVRGAVQAFGVRDEEVSTRGQMPLEQRHDPLLHIAIEIDHDVAAEDHVEPLAEISGLEEVELAVLDEAPHVSRHTGLACLCAESTLAVASPRV